MSSSSDLLTPLVGELGVGGVGGFLVGYAMKKIAKLVAMVLGIGFVGLQYLAYKGFIIIDYSAMRTWATNVVGGMEGAQNWVADFVAHAPFGAAFVGGFYFGLKKG